MLLMFYVTIAKEMAIVHKQGNGCVVHSQGGERAEEVREQRRWEGRVEGERLGVGVKAD